MKIIGFKIKKELCLILICILFANYCYSNNIIPDDDKTTVHSTQADIFEISTTEPIGENVIFNFKKFSIDSGETVLFQDSESINTIARVCGNSKSFINGKIESFAKHFFLLNPNGIIFGPDSQLSMNGAFHAIASYVENDHIDSFVSFHSQIFQDDDFYIDSIEKFGFIKLQNDIVLKGNVNNYENIVSLAARNIISENSGIYVFSTSGKKSSIALYATENIIFEGSGAQLDNSVLINDDVTIYEKAGDIFLNAKDISFLNGAGICSHSGISGGNIIINAEDTVRFSGKDNIGIESSIHTNIVYNEKHVENAGNIFIKGKTVVLNNHAVLKTDTNGTGGAGNISINCQQLEITDNSTISSESNASFDYLSPGNAGKIQISADSILLKNNCEITTNALAAQGGQISLFSNELMGINSQVSTSVMKGSGNGGNIHIQNKITALKSSNIIAGADKGDGGNIYIYSEQFFKSTESILDARSNEGNHGTVKVESPRLNSVNNLVALPKTYLDSDNWNFDPCLNRLDSAISSFIIHPKNGIPSDPDDWLPSPFPFFDDFSLTEIDSFQQGKKYYQNGHFIKAITSWEQASLILDSKSENFCYVMLYLSQAYQKTGNYFKAFDATLKIAPIVRNSDYVLKSLFFNQLGDLALCFDDIDFGHRKTFCQLFGKRTEECVSEKFNTFSEIIGIMGEKETYTALDYFETALLEANMQNNVLLQAISYNNTGNAYASDKYFFDAIRYYNKCLKISKKIQKSQIRINIIARTLINKIRAIIENQDYNIIELSSLISKTIYIMDSMDICHHKIFNYISLSMIMSQITHENPEWEKIIQRLLQNALQFAKEKKDIRMISFAHALMGKLYERSENFDEAISSIRKALFLASQNNWPVLEYLWQHQMGKFIMKKDELNIDAAQKAYKAAIDILHSRQALQDEKIFKAQDKINMIPGIFQTFYKGIRNRNNIFETKIKPLYLDFAETFLKKATQNNIDISKKELIAFRNIHEKMKIIELQDYFQDEWLMVFLEQFEKLKKLPDQTAMLYTVPANNSLLLLLTLSDDILYFNIPIDYNRLKRMIYNFSKYLINKSDRYLYYAKKLHTVLIHPIQKELHENNIHTLIIASDDVLRLVPFSALRDGNSFLIERYALVTVPSIPLTDTKAFNKKEMKVILSGLSNGEPSLPFVKNEINTIEQIIDKKIVLLNDQFTEQKLTNYLKDESFNVCLIATHANFSSEPENFYIQTFDTNNSNTYKKTTMNRLEKILKHRIAIGKPLDLIIFSACETVYSDKKAMSGIAGMAVKAGVRSVMATLQPIADEPASLIITDFFRQLKVNEFDDNFSKAMALQNAQKKMIDHNKYQHPGYWAPFVIIGNWL